MSSYFSSAAHLLTLHCLGGWTHTKFAADLGDNAAANPTHGKYHAYDSSL
jgi:hypothetical protein